MKKAMLATCVLVASTLWSSSATAQECKADVSRQDKISKEHVEVWAQELFATSFVGKVMSTSEMDIVATIGRYGAANAVSIQLQKREESATIAAFETAYRGAKEKPFYLAIENSEPVEFTVTSVSNAAAVDQRFFNFNSKKGVTTVILSALLPDTKLGELREVLTTGRVDAVRIMLADESELTKSIDEKAGTRLRDKFGCFYEYLDQQGVDLSPLPSSSAEALASAAGKYVRTDGSPNYITLASDGTFLVRQDGKDYSGHYSAVNGTIVMSGVVKRTGFLGDLISWEDGVYGTSKSVFAGGA